jgi:hypothetical protein
MGLLRKHRGRLVLTTRGRAARADPLALWRQLAERMPLRSADAGQTQAGLILLAAVAARTAVAAPTAEEDLDSTVARFLNAIGWRSSDGMPLTASMAALAGWDTKTVLRRIGALTEPERGYGPANPTAEGTVFARAALQVSGTRAKDSLRISQPIHSTEAIQDDVGRIE